MTIQGDWTTGELRLLREHASEGAAACARLLCRSVGSVKQAAHRNRISLRMPNRRSGLLLGQPRGTSLKREVRETLVRGRRDELVAERMRMDEEAEAALCPACGKRPARTADGWCQACSTQRLLELYEEITADDAACRELWAARQRRRAKLDTIDAAEGAL